METQHRTVRILILDRVGLKFKGDGTHDFSEVKSYVEHKGGVFHSAVDCLATEAIPGKLNFYYAPDLSTEIEIRQHTAQSQFDAVIAAATIIPSDAIFNLGGVRIGAGTGNMGSASWGGGNGTGGAAPLMNTPSFNSRATAQMVFKALLRILPDLNVEELHQRVVSNDFDTGRDLKNYPTAKLEGQKIAIVGYGNIGREVALIAKRFAMHVVVYARLRVKPWIESEGLEYAATVLEAATGADVISVHTGLGAKNNVTGKFDNVDLINSSTLNAMNDGSVLINYDRGEVVDTVALGAAMDQGKIRYAALDADVFVDEISGIVTGPMKPYLELQKRHADKMQLLPHAAADTDHPSRVAGAKQAVDQIFDCVLYKKVSNLRGDLPTGYIDLGSKTVRGVGAVKAVDIAHVAARTCEVQKLQNLLTTQMQIWDDLKIAENSNLLDAAIELNGSKLVKSFNDYARLVETLGLMGRYEDR
jgi:lactate dehydrogenase-like 2-hydroxyacid dehydrogenase